MSQSRVDTDGLSQRRLLMLHAAGSPVCLCRLIFPAGFSFKALRWAFKRLLRQHWRPPSDFPFLSPPVRCPFQWLIYGPHKCARDAEISEEVINRTKLRKRGGKRKQTEEVTGTCGVKARAWERLWLIISQFYCRVNNFPATLSTVLAVCQPYFFPSCQLTFELPTVCVPPSGLFS